MTTYDPVPSTLTKRLRVRIDGFVEGMPNMDVMFTDVLSGKRGMFKLSVVHGLDLQMVMRSDDKITTIGFGAVVHWAIPGTEPTPDVPVTIPTIAALKSDDPKVQEVPREIPDTLYAAVIHPMENRLGIYPNALDPNAEPLEATPVEALARALLIEAERIGLKWNDMMRLLRMQTKFAKRRKENAKLMRIDNPVKMPPPPDDTLDRMRQWREDFDKL